MEKNKNWLNLLLGHAKKCKWKMLASIITSILGILAGLVPFYIVYILIDAVINNDVINLKYNLLIMIVFYILSGILKGISTIFSHISAYSILENIRLQFINKLTKAPMGEILNRSIGEYKNLLLDKIESLEPPIAHFIPEVSGNFVLPIIVFIWLLKIDFKIALVSLCTIPLTFLIFLALAKNFKQKYDEYMKASTRVSSAIIEYIEGIEVIKTFSKTDISYKKYSSAILDFKHYVLEWMKSTWIPTKLAFAVFPSTLAGVLPVGIYLYLNKSISPSEFCLSILLSMGMIKSLARIEIFINEIKQMQYTIYEIDKFSKIKQLSESKINVIFNDYNIRLDKVSFSYDNKTNVISNCSLNIDQGKFTALVGPSGGGKSTIAKLICRYWDVNKGDIYIGNNNIKKIPLKQLSGLISYVSQDNFLFNISIMENIRLGRPDATDTEVINAAKKAACHQFINKLSDSYETIVGESGSTLSGGERQRITIARMILKNSPIVVLDEATSYTDPENEYEIQQSIIKLTKGKTLLVIAHRLSTIVNANQILVIKNGIIVEKGKHKQLVEKDSIYRDMWLAHIGAKSNSIIGKDECNV